MSDFQRVVEFLRDLRQAPLQHVNEEITQLAADYAKLCVQANDRLRQCSTFLQQGLRSEAIHLADETPNLLDLVAALDLPDHAAWVEFCQNNGLAIPPALQLDRAAQLNEAYAQDQPLEHLLARHRLLALSRAPVSDRLETLRRIAEIDAGNATWEKDIRVFERARLKELPNAFLRAVKQKDEGGLIALAQEVTQRPWLEPVPQDLTVALTDAYTRVQRAAVEVELRKLVEPLRDAYVARSFKECQAIVQRWRNIMSSAGVTAVAGELKDELTPVVAFINEETRREEHLKRFRDSCKAFDAMLGNDLPDAQLDAAYAKLQAFNEEIPAHLAQRLADRKKSRRAAAERSHKTRLAVIGAGAAAFIIIGLLVTWLVMQSNAGATAARRIETSVRAHTKPELEAATKYLEALRANNPGLLKETRLAAAVGSLQALQAEYDGDAGTVRNLVQKIAGVRTGAAPVVADPAAPLEKVSAAGAALQGVLNDAAGASKTAWADPENALAAAITSAQQDLTVLKGRATAIATTELDQVSISLNSIPARFSTPATAAAARTQLARLNERLERIANIAMLDEATKGSVNALARQVVERREAADALRTVAEVLDAVRAQADSPASLKGELEAFVKRFPDDPRTKDFTLALERMAGAPAVSAWQQTLSGFQGSFLVATPAAAQKRLDAVTAYTTAHPQSPLAGPGGPVAEYAAYLKSATEALATKGSWQTAYSDLLGTPLLSELGVMTVSDGRKYYTLGNVKRTERRINNQVSVTFEALDLKDMTKRTQIAVEPPLTVSAEPVPAAHTKVVAELAEQLKRVADNWDTFGIEVAERLAKNTEIDPVVRAILLVPALKTQQALTSSLIGDVYDRTLADLARQDPEQLPWVDPAKISEATRNSLAQIVKEMPPAADVRKKLVTARAAMIKRLSIDEVSVGVLLRDEKDAWKVEGPRVPTETSVVWALGAGAPAADGAATAPGRATLIKVGACERGLFVADEDALRAVPQGSIVYFTKP